MKTEELLFQEEYRRDTYKLLSECYYMPDEGLLTMLISLDRSRGSLYSAIADSIPTMNAIESLRIDFSKLFVGPYTLLAPPYGSVYLENSRKVMGDSTMDVNCKYAEEGLDITLKEPPDHIAIELEFMYFLIFKGIEASQNNTPDKTALYQRKQKNFLETHLGVWVSKFTSKVLLNAETAFYRNLSCLTKSFVEEDLKSLSDTSPLAS